MNRIVKLGLGLVLAAGSIGIAGCHIKPGPQGENWCKANMRSSLLAAQWRPGYAGEQTRCLAYNGVFFCVGDGGHLRFGDGNVACRPQL